MMIEKTFSTPYGDIHYWVNDDVFAPAPCDASAMSSGAAPFGPASTAPCEPALAVPCGVASASSAPFGSSATAPSGSTVATTPCNSASLSFEPSLVASASTAPCEPALAVPCGVASASSAPLGPPSATAPSGPTVATSPCNSASLSFEPSLAASASTAPCEPALAVPCGVASASSAPFAPASTAPCDPSASPSIVFLPGLSANHNLFDKQIEYFKTRYRLLVWDAPGHAASRPFRLEFSLQQKAEWLHDILSIEGFHKPIFVGQSMGGYVSQCYAQTYPEQMGAFVSIDSAPLQRKYASRFDLWFMRHCEPMYKLYPWKALLRDGAKGCSTTQYGQNLMAQMMSQYSPSEYCALVGHGYKMIADAISADLPYKLLCPTFLLCGEKDQAGFTKRYNKAWSKGENLPLHWIKNAGHNSNTDAPGVVNTFIEGLMLNC